MRVEVVNESTLSDESVRTVVDFAAARFPEVGMPVRVTFRNRPGWGSWGKAYWPVSTDYRRVIKPGEYSVRIYVGSDGLAGKPYYGRPLYPYEHEYKRRAGPMIIHDVVEELVHTLAHELRHVEQFDRLRAVRYEGALAARFTPEQAARDATWDFGYAWKKWKRSTRAGFPGGSSEVDAELTAHKTLAAYREHLLARAILDSARRGVVGSGP